MERIKTNKEIIAFLKKEGVELNAEQAEVIFRLCDNVFETGAEIASNDKQYPKQSKNDKDFDYNEIIDNIANADSHITLLTALVSAMKAKENADNLATSKAKNQNVFINKLDKVVSKFADKKDAYKIDEAIIHLREYDFGNVDKDQLAKENLLLAFGILICIDENNLGGTICTKLNQEKLRLQFLSNQSNVDPDIQSRNDKFFVFRLIRFIKDENGKVIIDENSPKGDLNSSVVNKFLNGDLYITENGKQIAITDKVRLNDRKHDSKHFDKKK